MQTYETLFVTTPTLTDDEERATVESLSEIVTGGGGTMVANDRMGRRRLAYPIMKHTDGVYVRFLYDSDADVPKALERRMRLSDKILRVLTVRLEERWALASKEQAVRDAQARIEAAEREAREAEDAAKLALEEQAVAAVASEVQAASIEPAGGETAAAAPPSPTVEPVADEAPAEDPPKPPVEPGEGA